MKKNIIIHMPGKITYRNFVETDAFEALEREFSVHYLFSEGSDIKEMEKFKEKKCITHEFASRSDQFRLLLRKFFHFRAARYSNTYMVNYKDEQGKPRKLSYLLKLLINKFTYKASIFILELFAKQDMDLINKIKEIDPCCLLLLCSTAGNIQLNLIKACQKLKVKSVVIPLGWDNISSKLLMYISPDTIIERGKQNVDLARNIFELKDQQVFKVGVPHYEMYFTYQQQADLSKKREDFLTRLGIPVDKKVILFGGALRPFDETSFLLKLERAIEKGILYNIHIIYRPHPERDARIKEKSYFDLDFKHITFDQELKHSYLNHKSNYMPNLENYLDLYNAITAIISPFSSVMVEAGLFGKPILALACNDGMHTGATSVEHIAKREHFMYLKKLDWFVECKDKDQFINKCLEVVKTSQRPNIEQDIKESLSHIVHHDDRSYQQRLLSIIKKIEEKQL